MIHVLEIFGEPISNGGQESFVFNLIKHMNRENMKIDLLTPYYCDNIFYKEFIKNIGGNLISLDIKFNPGGNRNTVKKPINNFLKNNKYDVVHIHSGSSSFLAIAAKCAKKNGIGKVIVHSHCGIEKINIRNIILKNLISFSLKRNVDVFCACSEIASEAKFTKSVQKNVHIIKNGVDLLVFNNNRSLNEKLRQELGIDLDTFVVGHVGRFNYQKNHEYLIDIFSKILMICPKSKLLLIGEGELKRSIKEKVNNLHINLDVIFTGNLNNVNEYMQVMDVFVLPSRFEGLPIVGVEAQASGLNVITSEQVSSELNLTKHVHYLSLELSPEEWAERILKFKGNIRFNSKDILIKSGYDINLTSDYVRKIYLSEN